MDDENHVAFVPFHEESSITEASEIPMAAVCSTTATSKTLLVETVTYYILLTFDSIC